MRVLELQSKYNVAKTYPVVKGAKTWHIISASLPKCTFNIPYSSLCNIPDKPYSSFNKSSIVSNFKLVCGYDTWCCYPLGIVDNIDGNTAMSSIAELITAPPLLSLALLWMLFEQDWIVSVSSLLLASSLDEEQELL